MESKERACMPWKEHSPFRALGGYHATPALVKHNALSAIGTGGLAAFARKGARTVPQVHRRIDVAKSCVNRLS